MVIKLGRYIGQERRISSPEERAQYLRDAPPSTNGRKQWKTLYWAVMTTLAAAAAVGLMIRAKDEGVFFWSLRDRVPELETRVKAIEKANGEKLDQIIKLLEDQKQEHK